MNDHSLSVLYRLSICGLLMALSVNGGVYAMLMLSSLLASVKLWQLRRVPGILSFALPALLFILYVALTPGRLFTDLPVGEVLFTAFLTGTGLVLYSPSSALALFRPAMLVLLLSLGLQSLWFCFSGAENLLWDSRLALIFDHPNVLGYVAAWAILFGGISLPDLWRESVLWRFVWGVLLVGAVIMVAFAGSRGVYVGLVLGLIPVLFGVYRRQLVLLVLTCCVAGGLVFVALPDKHQARLLSAVQNPLGDITMLGRMPIWQAALDGFSSSPLLGNGLRSFESYHEAFVQSHREELAGRSPYLENRVANPHSLYLGLLYAYGGVGVLLLVVFVGGNTLVAVRRSQPEDLFFLASVLFLGGAGLVDYSLHRKEGIMMFMIPAGMVYARSLYDQFHTRSTLPSTEK